MRGDVPEVSTEQFELMVLVYPHGDMGKCTDRRCVSPWYYIVDPMRRTLGNITLEKL